MKQKKYAILLTSKTCLKNAELSPVTLLHLDFLSLKVLKVLKHFSNVLH